MWNVKKLLEFGRLRRRRWVGGRGERVVGGVESEIVEVVGVMYEDVVDGDVVEIEEVVGG